MTRILRLLCCVWVMCWVITGAVQAEEKLPLIGQSEKVYTLADENTEIRGVAFDDVSANAPRLFVLDGAGWIFVYKLDQNSEEGVDELNLLEKYELAKETGESLIANPRGLAFALEKDCEIFYFLNWDNSGSGVKSELWRCDFKGNVCTHVDLTRYEFSIGQREPFDLACEGESLFVCFDSSGYGDNDLRVQRGIIQLRWNEALENKCEFVKHLPDSGEFTSLGLACMKFEGAQYLWATAGGGYIYSADGQTGRGLFYFDRPKSTGESEACHGLAFGADALWVPEGVERSDCVHRVNVTKNPDAFYEGPRILRHLVMTILTEPEKECSDPGKAQHYYSRPYAYEQLHNQGVWPETEKVVDESGADNAAVKAFTYDPAGDKSSRQYMSLVEYANAPAKIYSSRYEIDIWTNPYRKYVYPHRVDRNLEQLAGTDYLADDPNLFDLSDTETYEGFFKRVAAHIEEKYGVKAEMSNPYWAVRNALEYIQDNYYYPSRPHGRPATVDYNRNHYDANPGNLKIALSGRDYDKTQITACSGTSVMLAGAMRYLGVEARWLGTGTQKAASTWDENHNGLLDEDESAPCSSGHRYTQVWLGSHYGWICFDATPTKPENSDYDVVPPMKSQWRYMNRAAKGHLLNKRIVFNVGSELFVPLYRDFEYDERLAVDNNCGGDQRYNLQGRFEKKELWKLPRHRISVENLCFIEEVKVSGPKEETKVSWKLKGAWDKDPGARISVYLQQVSANTERGRDIARLAEGIDYDAAEVVVDLSNYRGKLYRIKICKDGDSETGGYSQTFDLK